MRTDTALQELPVSSFPSQPSHDSQVSWKNEIADDAAGESLQSEKEQRDALIIEHMQTVRYVARRVFERLPQHADFDDLVSAGLVGLIDAASKFDLKKQVRFKSYAQFRIRGAILDSLRVLDWSPRELRRQGREMAEAIRILSAKLGRTPNDSEIAEEMGMALVHLQQLTGELKGLQMSSLETESADEPGEIEVRQVAAPLSEDPLHRCIEGQTRQQLAAAIEILPEKERLILTLSYYEELTLKEIGQVLGVVESRVCQIRSAAVARLRKVLLQHTGTIGMSVSSRTH